MPRGAVARFGSVRLRHAARVSHLAFSPDGKLLVSVAKENRIHVWDAASGRKLTEFAHPFLVQCLAFTPDSRQLATGTADGKVQLWSLPAGKLLRTVEVQGETKKVYAVAFHQGPPAAAGKEAPPLLMATGGREFVKVWQLPKARVKWQQRWILAGATGGRLAFTTDGKHLVVVTRSVTTRSVATGRMFRDDPRGDPRGPVWLSTNGRYLVTRDVQQTMEPEADRDVLLRDLSSPGARPRAVTRHRSPPRVLAVSAAGTVASAAGDIRVCGATAGDPGCRRLDPERWVVADALALSPDGSVLAAGGRDNTVRLWDTTSGRQLLAHVGHQGQIQGLAVSPDGRVVYSVGKDNRLRVWDASRGKVTRVMAGARRTLAISGDGKLLAAGSGSGVSVWEAHSGDRTAWLPAALPSSPLVFLADNKTVLAQCGTLVGNADLCAYDARTGQPRWRMRMGKVSRGRYGVVSARSSALRWRGLSPTAEYDRRGRRVGPLYVDALAVSSSEGLLAVALQPDEPLQVGGSNATPLLVVGLAARDLRYDIYTHQGGIHALSFSPDGRYLASGGLDGALRLRDMNNGEEVADVVAHKGEVRSVAYSPAGGMVATAGDDLRAKVWKLTSVKAEEGEPEELLLLPLRDFAGHRGLISSVLFFPDGLGLLSGSHDTSLLIWNLGKKSNERPPSKILEPPK